MMKLFWVISIVLLAGIFSGCKNNSDLRGDATLAGTLYFKNTLDGLPDSSVAAGVTLYIQYQSVGTASYLYAAKTGPDGKFLFSNLVSGKAYIIFTNVDTFGIVYTAMQVYKAGLDNITLTLAPLANATNGFVVVVKDYLHMPVGNFPVYGFGSQSQADYNDSAGATYPMITDVYGYVYRFNIGSGWYYLNAAGIIDNLSVKGRDSFFVPPNQVHYDSLILDTAVNGFEVTAVDPQQGPVANLPMYVFNSPSAFMADTTTGYAFLLQTNVYGAAELLNIQPGTYYVKAWDTVGHIIYGGKDTIIVGKSGMTVNTFNLQVYPVP
jgi:hypothetical protein